MQTVSIPTLMIVGSVFLVAGCATAKPVATGAIPQTAQASPEPAAGPMSCKSCKAATDSLKSARAAAQEALRSDDKEKLKAALRSADAQMAKMEGHKEKCMAMMKDTGKPDTAAVPEAAGHDHH